jgi:predicted dehydrogenase
MALCDRNAELLRQVGTQHEVSALYLDYEDFLASGVELVVVATPPEFHVPYSVAALERGCHVLSEVPAANNLEECPRLLRAALAGPGKYMLGENCNYWAFLQAWKELVRAGRIGKLIYAEGEYIHSCADLMRTADGERTWRADLPPIHYCTHELGPLLALAGDRCVSAVGMSTGCNVAPDLGTIDMEVALFRTAQGAAIKLLCGFSVRRQPAFHFYSVYGTEGCLETARSTDRLIDPPPGTTHGYFTSLPPMQAMARLPLRTVHSGPEIPEWAATGGHGTAEYMMLTEFLRSIENDTSPPIDVWQALEISVPGLVAHQSALQGGTLLEIPDFHDWV